MENENIEDLDSQTQEEVITQDEPKELGLPEDPVEIEPKDTDDDIETLKRTNQALYERMKKAEGFVRVDGKWVKKEQPRATFTPKQPAQPVQPGIEDVSKTELFSLIKANVSDEDIEEVVIYARSHAMSVTEALKRPEVKAILKVKEDYRKTAETANTRGSRSSLGKISDDQIMADMAEGKLPSPEKLAEIAAQKRMARRQAK